jgi:hypothetical protein
LFACLLVRLLYASRNFIRRKIPVTRAQMTTGPSTLQGTHTLVD